MNMPGSSRRDARTGPGWFIVLVIAIPLATIVAGFATLWLAVRSGSTDAVIDPVTRTAQVQDSNLRADHSARALGLNARLDVDGRSLLLRLRLGDLEPTAPPMELTLILAHPLQHSEDLTVQLNHQGGGEYLGQWGNAEGLLRRHAWNLQLAPPDAGWRLVGRMSAGAGASVLRPALDALDAPVSGDG